MTIRNIDEDVIFNKHLSEKSSHIITLEYKPIIGTKECLRYWKLTDNKDVELYCRLLDEYSSANNYPGSPQHYIIDPESDRLETLQGTWRVVYNRGAKSGEQEGVYQLLREGWSEGLNDDEAIIEKMIGNYADNTLVLTRYWRNIAPDKLADLVTELKEVDTVTNPVIDNDTLTGVFASSDIVGNITDDGTGIIRQTLTQVFTVTGANEYEKLTVLNTFEYLLTQENSILEPLALSTGEQDSVAFVWKNLNPDNQSTLELLSDDGLRDKFTDSSFAYTTRTFKREVNNTLTMTVVFTKTTWNDFDYETPDLEWTDNSGRNYADITQLWFKIENDDDLTNLHTSSLIGYNVTQVRINERNDGAINISRVLTQEIKGVVDDELEENQEITIDPHAFQSGTLHRIKIINENLADISSAYGTLSEADYTLVDSSEQLLKNGLWNKYYTYEKTVWRAWLSGGTEETPAASDPDLTTTDNEGTKSESVTKTWFGIQASDKDSAVTALVDGGDVGADTGFTVDTVRVSDNKNGSVTITQHQIMMVRGVVDDELEENQEITIDPHAFQSGKLYRVNIVNTNLDAVSSAYTVLSSTDTYIVVDKKEDFNKSTGLWDVTHTYERTVWRAWTYSLPPDLTITDNEGTFSESVTKTWFGIQASDKDTAITTLEKDGTVGADSGYVVKTVRVNDNKNGSITITQVQDVAFAWGHDSGAYDSISYDNAGTSNEKERITKTWNSIQSSDLSTAIEALRTGTTTFAPETGYIITSATARENSNGTITLSQSQKKQVDNKDVNLVGTQNRHGRQYAIIERIETIYESFNDIDTATSSETAPTNYKLVDSKETLGSDGLYNKIYIYEKVSWHDYSDDETPLWADHITVSTSGAGGVHEVVRDSVSGIPIADASTAITAAKTADTNYVVSSVAQREAGNGAVMVYREQVKKQTGSMVSEFITEEGRRPEKEITIWYDVTETVADAIIAEAKSSTHTTYPFQTDHILYSVRKTAHAGYPLFNVVRSTYKVITIYNVVNIPSGATGITKTFIETRKTNKYSSGSEYREWDITYDIGYDSSESDARSAQSTGKNCRFLNSTVWRARGNFWGYRKITSITVGDWTELPVGGKTWS